MLLPSPPSCPSALSWGSRCPAGAVNLRPVSRCSPTQTCQLVSTPARPFPGLAGLSRRRGDTEGSDWTVRLDLVPCPLRLRRGGPGVWMLSQPASPLGLSVGAGLLLAASPVAGLEICPPCCWLCLPAASHGLVRTQDQLPASSTSSVCRSHPWGAGGGGGSICFSWEIFRDVEGEAVEQCCQVSLGGCVPPRPHQLGTGLSTESPGWALPRGHCEAASGGSQPPSGSEFDGNIHSQSLGWGCTMCEPSLGLWVGLLPTGDPTSCSLLIHQAQEFSVALASCEIPSTAPLSCHRRAFGVLSPRAGLLYSPCRIHFTILLR